MHSGPFSRGPCVCVCVCLSLSLSLSLMFCRSDNISALRNYSSFFSFFCKCFCSSYNSYMLKISRSVLNSDNSNFSQYLRTRVSIYVTYNELCYGSFPLEFSAPASGGSLLTRAVTGSRSEDSNNKRVVCKYTYNF